MTCKHAEDSKDNTPPTRSGPGRPGRALPTLSRDAPSPAILRSHGRGLGHRDRSGQRPGRRPRDHVAAPDRRRVRHPDARPVRHHGLPMLDRGAGRRRAARRGAAEPRRAAPDPRQPLRAHRGRRGPRRRRHADHYRRATALGRGVRWRRGRDVRGRVVRLAAATRRAPGARSVGVPRGAPGRAHRPGGALSGPDRPADHGDHGLLVVHPGGGPGSRADSRRRGIDGSGRRHRRHLPAHLRRLQLAARHGPRTVPPVRPRAQGAVDRRGLRGASSWSLPTARGSAVPAATPGCWATAPPTTPST